MKGIIIGYGSIGERHIRNLFNLVPSIEIIVCTNRKPDKFLRKHKCKVLSSVEECIKENPNFAIIANDTNLHMKTALKLAKAGIHFFCEKPLSHSLSSSQRLLELIRKKKLVTLLGCNLRFHPCIKSIKELIKKGTIGRVISVKVENGSFLPEWHPHEDYRKSYAARRDLGGGVVLTCIHEIDYLYWFFGPVKEIFSITGKFSDLKISADDLSSMVLLFQNNVVGEIHLDYFQGPTFRSCKVMGTIGTIYWDSNTNTVKLYHKKKKKWSNKMISKNYNDNQMYTEELHHFLNCLKGNEKSINNVKEGVKTLKIALSAIKSSKNKKVIKL